MALKAIRGSRSWNQLWRSQTQDQEGAANTGSDHPGTTNTGSNHPGSTNNGRYSFIFTYKSVIIAVVMLMVWSFVCEYWNLYLEIYALNAAILAKGVPPGCQSEPQGLKDKLLFLSRRMASKFSWGDDACEAYYKALYVNPFTAVNPVQVITSVIAKGILQPLLPLSDTAGLSLRKFFSRLPVQGQLVVVLIIVAGILISAFAYLAFSHCRTIQRKYKTQNRKKIL